MGWEAQEGRDIHVVVRQKQTQLVNNCPPIINKSKFKKKKNHPIKYRKEIREESGDISRGQLKRVQDGCLQLEATKSILPFW